MVLTFYSNQQVFDSLDSVRVSVNSATDHAVEFAEDLLNVRHSSPPPSSSLLPLCELHSIVPRLPPLCAHAVIIILHVCAWTVAGVQRSYHS